MKFSPRKKAKMRKQNQRRIKRCCGNMIGGRIDFEHGGYEVKDQAEIKGTMYLLIQVEDGNYAIYKIVKAFQYIRLSQKKVLENKKALSNHEYWKEHSTIEITEEGKIQSVKFGSWWGPYNAQPLATEGDIHIYIII